MKKFIFTILAILLSIQPALAAIYYAGGSGTGTNCTDYQTISTPAATMSIALACLNGSPGAGSGHTVRVLAGTYDEFVNSAAQTFPTGTSWSSFFTFEANPGDIVTFRSTANQNLTVYGSTATYALIRGFIFDGAVNSSTTSTQVAFGSGTVDADFIRFEDNEIINTIVAVSLSTGSAANNIEIRNNKIHGGSFGSTGPGGEGGGFGYPIYHSASDSIIEHNEIYDFPSWGIHLNADPPLPDDNIIRFNTLHDYGQFANTPDNRGSCIIVFKGARNKVYGNICYRGHAGIQSNQTESPNLEIYNNTIDNMLGDNNSNGGIESNSTATIRNNILTRITGAVIGNSGLGTINTNLSDGAAAGIDIVGNPLFADADNGDFRLCKGTNDPHPNCGATPSPAIDAGVDLGSSFNVDIVGTSRPQPIAGSWDIGAYEAGSITPPMCPAAALVLQLPFEGNSNDLSGQGNNGSDGAGITYVAGKYGQAASFPGTTAGKITVATASSLWICNGMTIAAWVKPTTTPTTYQSLVTKLNLVGNQGPFFYSATAPGYCTNSGTAAGYLQGGDTHACHGTALTPNVWTHMTATWDGTTLRIRKNGTLVTTASGTAVLSQNSGPMMIAGSFYDEFFGPGALDEIWVVNCAIEDDPACLPAGVPTTIAGIMNTPILATSNFGTLKLNLDMNLGGSDVKFGAVP